MKDYKIIKLHELYYLDFDISDSFAMRQKWKLNALFNRSEPRRRTGIIYLNSCVGIYTDQSGNKFIAPEKSIVCLPESSIYTCLNFDCAETINDAIMVEFNITIGNTAVTLGNKPFIINDVNIPIAAELFNETVQSYESSLPSSLEIKSSIYRLLSHICKERVQKRQKRFQPINTGIELIESNPLSDISIEEIAHSCNVSPCYFRRLFKEYSGKSPLEYRINLKLNMAKRMLENGESTLEYISEALNFESTSYFCRIFKKKFGITPGQYQKSAKTN